MTLWGLPKKVQRTKTDSSSFVWHQFSLVVGFRFRCVFFLLASLSALFFGFDRSQKMKFMNSSRDLLSTLCSVLSFHLGHEKYHIIFHDPQVKASKQLHGPWHSLSPAYWDVHGT